MPAVIYIPARDGLSGWSGEQTYTNTIRIVNGVLRLSRGDNAREGDRFARYMPFDSPDGEMYALFSTASTGDVGLIGLFSMRWRELSKRGGEPSGYTLGIISDRTSPSGQSLWLENGKRKLASYPIQYYQHGNSYCARFSVVGNTIKAKLWPSADPEPGWQIAVTDSSVPVGPDRISNGIFTFAKGSVDYSLITFAPVDETAPSASDISYRSRQSNPIDNRGIVAGMFGGFPAGGAYVPIKTKVNYNIVGETTARLTASTPRLSHKYSVKGNKGFPWVAIEIKKIIYKEPGKLYISPSTEVARVKISQPTLNYKAPPNVNIVGNTTKARITTNLPSITFSSKHAIIADETIARIELPQPTIVFKDVERYTFYVDPVTARIRTTVPSIRFKRVQINPDVWTTPQSEIEHEWRKLPYTSEATGAWQAHQYYRSDDQVWRNNRKEDTSQWRKPVSTTRDEQEWRRVVYD